MKIETYDDKRSVQILAGMIMNSQVLGKITSTWNNNKKMFDNPWCNIVAPLLFKYYERYSEAPKKKGTVSLLQAWGEKTRDQSTIAGIEKLWQSLEPKLDKEINADYVIDMASSYFTDVRIKRAIELAQGYKDLGKQQEALEALQACSKLEIGSGSPIGPFQDEVEMQSTFDTAGSETVVQYPGDLGELFRHSLERDAFVAFCAPEKRGKTWWLLDMAWRGMLQRKRILFFEVGDMSKRQLSLRMYTRAARKPFRSATGQWPYTVRWPTAIRPPAEVDVKEKVFQSPLDTESALKACQRVQQEILKSNESYFRLFVHPPFSVSARGIREQVKNQIQNGWTPDVVVIDYADILEPPPGKEDTRDKYDKTWGTLRGIAGEFGCMVLTATQANRKAYDAPVITMGHMSEDKRKLAHATALYGINVNPDEREKGLARINCFAAREKEHSPGNVVHVAGCLPLGNPSVLSVWGERR